MWTGREALSNIDQSLQTIRNDMVRLDKQAARLSESMTSGQRHRVKLINDIAAVRLGELEQGSLQSSLTAADQQAMTILEQRELALSSITDEIEQINKDLRDAEKAREMLLVDVNEQSQELATLEARVQSSLKSDESYLAQFDIARQAESVAEEADRKVKQAQADMAAKAAPYQQDPLFMYLWNRGYGTTKYKAGLIARFMDGWVARVIKYEPARINYWNLIEIPKRFDHHADMVSDRADQQYMVLQEMEGNALERAGAEKLQNELADKQKSLDKQDDLVEGVELELKAKLDARARFMAGEDDYVKQCVTRLAKALDHQDLEAIHQYVKETGSLVDDQLLVELQGLDRRLSDVVDDLAGVRSTHDKKMSKLNELEQVRRNFKNSRFDDVRSGIDNESLLASVLTEFIQGVVTGSDVWRVIQQNQRYQHIGSAPDFGSGSLGSIGDLLGPGSVGGRRRSRRRRSSSWHIPRPKRGGDRFRIPSSRNDGGFRTGGGF